MKCHKFQFQSIQYRGNKFRVDFVGMETKNGMQCWHATLKIKTLFTFCLIGVERFNR